MSGQTLAQWRRSYRRYRLRHARPCPGGCGGLVVKSYSRYCPSCNRRLAKAAGRVHTCLSAEDKRKMAHAAVVALFERREPVRLGLFGGWTDGPAERSMYPDPDSCAEPDSVGDVVWGEPLWILPVTM